MSGFMIDPKHLHLVVVRRIIHYLLRPPTRGLFFPAGTSLTVHAYFEADWASCHCQDTRRYTTWWCMFLGDSLISWKCKKQDKVSKSSTDAEYQAVYCSEILWLGGLLSNLGFPMDVATPLCAIIWVPSGLRKIQSSMRGPNTLRLTAISFVMNTNGKSSSFLVSSKLQLSDIFTKGFPWLCH